ncbi:LuxR C-terminal-related transcriptional regulator [Methylomonas sp. MED-D]|uniref:response regulator transcription factor n=1 Tax=unclassified Methylomonas TaxID=2608980 RepID=UPI0028A340A8|nr:response regulator transcription factor [Methylomonas sp. MV1]MDT4331829.1 response regulator transcription factor [Methylomonas sp. MV1]
MSVTLRAVLSGAEAEALGIDVAVLAAQGIALSPEDGITTDHADIVLLAGAGLPTRIRSLASTYPDCKIAAVIEMSVDDALSCLASGALGVLLAPLPADRLARILVQIAAGGYFIDQRIAQMLALRQLKKILEPFSALSSREYDVFCLLADGKSLAEIAVQLGVSRKTVSNTQTQIKLKLGLSGRPAIVACAKRHGLVG